MRKKEQNKTKVYNKGNNKDEMRTQSNETKQTVQWSAKSKARFLKKTKKVERLTLFDFKTYYKITVIKRYGTGVRIAMQIKIQK